MKKDSICPETLKPEIDHHTTRLIVGLIAIVLPFVTSYFSKGEITSLSAAYFENNISRDIFVGFLFAIAAFLLSYNGKNICEVVLSKVAAVAALGVALFPCVCKAPSCEKETTSLIQNIHGISAIIMFLILAYFCYSFYKSAKQKVSEEGQNKANALLRSRIYAISGIIILGSIFILVLDDVFLSCNPIQKEIVRLVFYLESAALIAFGVSWLTASLTVPIISHHSERCNVMPQTKPKNNK